MKKGLILIVVILSVIGVFFTLVLLRVPLGVPDLRIEFHPPPPWHVRPGDTFEVSIAVANDAWLLAWAKDVRAIVSLPEGFTNSRTGTNECELHFFTLHGGDGLGNGLTIRVSENIPPGNYTITIKLSAQNVPEEVFTPDVIVAT